MSLDSIGWDTFIGQEPLKARLDVHIRAALSEQRPLDHVFLSGPPGFGKTTLAGIIAERLGDPFHVLTCPVKPQVLVSLLRQWDGGVLLLDEIHRATKAQQEDLLNLLHDGFYQGANGIRVEAPWLTVIGATTEPEKITPAVWDRFPIKPTIDPYTPEEMAEMVAHMALAMEVDCGIEILAGIAAASSGVPRKAKTLVKAARDLQTGGRPVTMDEILYLTNTDPMGLSDTHLQYIDVLRKLGGQAGLDTISTMLRLHPSVVREAERALIDNGLIMYGNGRELTNKGWRYGKPEAAKSPRRTQ